MRKGGDECSITEDSKKVKEFLTTCQSKKRAHNLTEDCKKSGSNTDIKDVSDWSKDKLQSSDEEEVINYEEEVI